MGGYLLYGVGFANYVVSSDGTKMRVPRVFLPRFSAHGTVVPSPSEAFSISIAMVCS